MKLVLLTAAQENCNQCEDAEKQFKKVLWRELDSGEAPIVDVDSNEEFQEMWMTHDLPDLPIIALVTDKNKLITYIEPEDLFGDLIKASPASAEADTAPIESSG